MKGKGIERPKLQNKEIKDRRKIRPNGVLQSGKKQKQEIVKKRKKKKNILIRKQEWYLEKNV